VSELTYHRPKTLADVWRIRAEFPEALYIAGGTDVLGLGRSACVRPKALISLRRINELHGIEVNGAADGGGTRIGSLSTIDDVLAHTALGERYPVLHDAARP
jgi:xanthine dehydrogenase YagS FAD-binding subunit